jgi:hypothetical protein
MKKKKLSAGIIALLIIISGACNDWKAEEESDVKQTVVAEENAATENDKEENTGEEELVGEGIHIDGLQGQLSYYPDYRMWGVRHVVPGTIDSVDLYLIKDGVGDLPEDASITDVSIEVVFSGDYYPSSIQSPLGALTIYYITNFRYEKI